MFQDFGGPSSIFTMANSTGFHTGLFCAPIGVHTKTVSNKNAVARQKLVIVSFAPTGFAGRSAITPRQSVQTPHVALQMLLELYVSYRSRRMRYCGGTADFPVRGSLAKSFT